MLLHFMQFRWSKFIFVIKKTRKSFSKSDHIAIWVFYNNICDNHSSIQGRKLFKWGNYSKEETIQGRKLLIIRRFWPRKLFKGGNYSREEIIWGNTVYELYRKNEKYSTFLYYWKSLTIVSHAWNWFFFQMRISKIDQCGLFNSRNS